MLKNLVAVIGLFALLTACAPPSGNENATAAPEAASGAGCPDDGPRLPVTNICAGRAGAYLDPKVMMTSEVLPEGCTWVINDARMGADDEAILYQAARCTDKTTQKVRTTQLELRAGARSAALGYVVSGLYENVPADFEPVRIFTTEGQSDPKATILAMARETTEDKQEAAACQIRALNPPGSAVLADAFVIDVNDAYKKAKKLADGDIHPACGPFGMVDGQRYWVIRQGYAWFVDFGQDLPDFNPNSILRMKREAGGAWTAIQ